MFEKYMIVPEEARNVTENGRVTGFQFGARLPYYRGVGLSLVEDIQVKIDGEPVAPENLTVTVHGNTYTLEEMARTFEDRWEMGEVALITIRREGGLPPGEHTIDLLLNLRISYLPFPAIRKATKTIKIP
ncbi:hypothetical protein GQ464_000160 [Rhodocaloribacter litoris]|uniref:C-glycoside deglycosidase beta subunit domain-containing protein n=1 Tax=Rhodocaloribacter litoris TaxID=2558931 RepID=UPI00141E2562|nr:DUF6379 domain-containing protein [Rhodocaloribacter litoris]QXD15408.1 hypothetical protein GQ464_000160 [Rhodocaloribacter litoris]